MGIFSSSGSALWSGIPECPRSGQCRRSTGKWISHNRQRTAGKLFSPVGHFIVLRGVTDDGLFLVNDPAGKYPVNREFTWAEIERPQNFYMIFGE